MLNMNKPCIISHCSFNLTSTLVNYVTEWLVTSYSYPILNNNNSDLRFK